MWGRFYWGKKEEDVRKAEGIVVLFAWLSSQDKHLRPYVDLYWSLGWICLVCHVDFLTLFLPAKASGIARCILEELTKEVKARPLPIVLASFSGGSKGCLYKMLQLLEGNCEGQRTLQGDYSLVRECISGQIYDSSPTDFTSDLGTRFALQPSVLKLSSPPMALSWMAKALASGLDALFINRFEAERAEYWQTLYASVNFGPFLILCSENDELAPFAVVSGFGRRLQELGGHVNLIKWSSSSHVAHYKYHRAEYTVTVTELLAKASLKYSTTRELRRGSCEQILNFAGTLNPAESSYSENLRGAVSISPSDHSFLPSSLEIYQIEDGDSLFNAHKRELFELPSTKYNRDFGRIFVDVRAPKKIEGWEIAPMPSLNRNPTFSSSSRHGSFIPIRCYKRSRL